MNRKELVKQAVLSVTGKDVKKYGDQSCAVTIHAADECKPKQLENAVAEYAKGCRPEDIAVLVDQTIMGSGKKGFLFTADGFYASRNVLVRGPLGKPCIPYPVVYDEIDSVRVDPREAKPDYLIIDYKSGEMKRAYGCIDNCYIVAVLNAILKALEVARGQEEAAEEKAATAEAAGTQQAERWEETTAGMQPAERVEEERQPEESAPPVEPVGEETTAGVSSAEERESQEAASEEGTAENREPREAISEELSAEGRQPEETASKEPPAKERQQEETSTGEKEPAETPSEGPVEKESASPEARFAAKKAEAESGDAQAQFDLGLMYENGEGTAADPAAAFHWYETAAKQGHSKAQNYTGYACKKGMGTEPDGKKAVSWYKKSAMGGYAPAQRNYALALLKGDGCEKDAEEALYWMEQSAENGHDRAQERVAQMYEDGEGCEDLPEETRKKKARGWYEKAAENGKVNSQFSCAFMYYNGEGGGTDRQKALHWFLQAAGQGNSAAQMNCGVMYLNGDGAERDLGEALFWMEKAAENGQEGAQALCEKIRETITAAQKAASEAESEEALWKEIRRRAREEFEQEKEAAQGGDPEAQYRLAEKYHTGRSGVVEQDQAEALRWYESAARQGHARSQFQCALMYRDGEGTQADQMKAVEWCRKSALLDDAKAQYLLGIMYYGGDHGMPRNVARGIFWLGKAKDHGRKDAEELWEKASEEETIQEAISDFDEIQLLKEDVRKDETELMYARKKAAENGNAAAQYWYAEMLSAGEGTDQNEDDALYWYEQAAGQGDARAMYVYGKYFHDKDQEKAFYWYKKAAENGNGYAQYELARIYDEVDKIRLSNVEKDMEKAQYWYKKAVEQGVDAAKARYCWITMFEQPDARKKLASMEILLCTDMAFHMQRLTRTLQECGFEKIYEITGTEELVKLYRKRKPAMVFLGLVMGEKMTTDVIERLEREQPDAKVILLYRKGLEDDAADVVQKKYRVVVQKLKFSYTEEQFREVIMRTMMR